MWAAWAAWLLRASCRKSKSVISIRTVTHSGIHFLFDHKMPHISSLLPIHTDHCKGCESVFPRRILLRRSSRYVGNLSIDCFWLVIFPTICSLALSNSILNSRHFILPLLSPIGPLLSLQCLIPLRFLFKLGIPSPKGER